MKAYAATINNIEGESFTAFDMDHAREIMAYKFVDSLFISKLGIDLVIETNGITLKEILK